MQHVETVAAVPGAPSFVLEHSLTARPCRPRIPGTSCQSLAEELNLHLPQSCDQSPFTENCVQP